MGIDIKSGNTKVIGNGVFISLDEKPSIITLKYGKERLNFEIHFLEDESKELKVNFERQDNTSLIIKFYNFNSALGSGNTKTIELGEINNKKLYGSFRISRLNEKDVSRTVIYTFYLEE